MSDIKYTKDGRKVRVVGQLNNQESIVQEIYVSGDSEIPAGENFTVTTLLDQPAESWKEKKLRELEERYERQRKEWEAKLDRLHAERKKAADKVELEVRAYKALAKNANAEQLDRLGDYLAGRITHFFIKKAHEPGIVAWDSDRLYQKKATGVGLGRDRIEEMKLVTLMGKSNGDLDFRLSQYSDGSGGFGEEIVPCRSYDEALREAQSYLADVAEAYCNGDIGGFALEKWKKIEGIRIPPAAIAKLKAEKEASRQNRIAKLREELEQLESGYV